MTNKDAIEVLRKIGLCIPTGVIDPSDFYLVLALAIKALEERPQGKWVIVDDTEKFIAKCSVCGRIEDSRMVKEYPFCHCGAEMKGGDKNG